MFHRMRASVTSNEIENFSLGFRLSQSSAMVFSETRISRDDTRSILGNIIDAYYHNFVLSISNFLLDQQVFSTFRLSLPFACGAALTKPLDEVTGSKYESNYQSPSGRTCFAFSLFPTFVYGLLLRKQFHLHVELQSVGNCFSLKLRAKQKQGREAKRNFQFDLREI